MYHFRLTSHIILLIITLIISINLCKHNKRHKHVLRENYITLAYSLYVIVFRFIHHSNKDGKQRGTSRREDVLDTVIGLRHPGSYDPEQGAVFEVHFEKSRGFAGNDAKPFEARLQTDERGGLIWTYRTIEESTYDQVCKLANEGLTQKEITQELGLHKSSVSRHIKRGKSESDILTSGTVV